MIKPSLRVTKRYNIFTLPSEGALFVIGLIYVIATLLIALHAVIGDAWTIKEWILYILVCLFGGITSILYASA